jgi:hypothetical protein
VGIFLQEVVFHLPRGVDARLIGQLNLGQCILEELEFTPFGPWPAAADVREKSRVSPVSPSPANAAGGNPEHNS